MTSDYYYTVLTLWGASCSQLYWPLLPGLVSVFFLFSVWVSLDGCHRSDKENWLITLLTAHHITDFLPHFTFATSSGGSEDHLLQIKFQCGLCGYMYSRKDTLKDHIRGKHILPKHVNISQLIGVVPASKLPSQWLVSDFKRRLLLKHMLIVRWTFHTLSWWLSAFKLLKMW